MATIHPLRPTTQTSSSPRILVIDDDENILDIAQALFTGITGNEVHVANGGQAGFDLFRRFPVDHFDIITLDMNMPDVDGVQLVRMLAEASFRGSLAVMSGMEPDILSAVGDLVNEYQLFSLGAVAKPITREALEELVNKHQKRRLQKDWEVTRQDVTADEMEKAISGNRFAVAYQPIISTATRKVVAIEALCRWPHPEKGMVPPDVFIPVAESSGLIKRLTRLVIAKAFADVKTLHLVEPGIEMSINVSMDDLVDLSLPEYIDQTSKKYAINLQKVMLEITESRLLEDMKSTLEVLARIRMLGVRLSIDDFGTGFSSAEKLSRLPFSELKIDQSFVTNMSENSRLHKIFESHVFLSRNLALKCVAEGVETRPAWDMVVDSGCDMVQGYYIAKPMAMPQLLVWIGEWHKRLNSTGKK